MPKTLPASAAQRLYSGPKIDTQIGDGDGVVEEAEAAVAKAANDVFDATGVDIRPLLLATGSSSMTLKDEHGLYAQVTDNGRSAETLYFVTAHEAGHVVN